jgi:hypothetical protein
VRRLPDHLRADCSQCCALCCIAHSFDATQGFGYNKPAQEACRHLQHDFRCGIHADLPGHGFPGCASFDCHGAGQHVTRKLFDGASWKQSPEVAAQMFEVYSRVRTLHELMAMLTLAMEHARSDDLRLGLQRRLEEMEHHCAEIAHLPDLAHIVRLRSETLELVRSAVSIDA